MAKVTTIPVLESNRNKEPVNMFQCTVCKQEIPDNKQLCKKCQTHKTQIELSDRIQTPIHKNIDLGVAGTIRIKNPA